MSADSPDNEGPPRLFSSSVESQLALMAAGLGVIAVGSLLLEWWTDRSMAKLADLGIPFVSLPLGVGTAILAGLTATKRPVWAMPSGVLAVVYFVLYLVLS